MDSPDESNLDTPSPDEIEISKVATAPDREVPGTIPSDKKISGNVADGADPADNSLANKFLNSDHGHISKAHKSAGSSNNTHKSSASKSAKSTSSLSSETFATIPHPTTVSKAAKSQEKSVVPPSPPEPEMEQEIEQEPKTEPAPGTRNSVKYSEGLAGSISFANDSHRTEDSGVNRDSSSSTMVTARSLRMILSAIAILGFFK